ncbi:DDE-type integrase/transposase/recombinase [Thalassotalea euphylliae]|uniref:Integrase catalytic domain-containing protein n=1 Tax=Thalassotalea euphylliae TaxID=1655234 RepID=A0A3E0U3F0_9GAMM|nr:DDE-type integrase/transposase/recombinase [Thalassotalea euphylliae]REL31250.1 hypothetical protein DXX94_11300 [Thalassotalea euphylliae]
MKTASLRVGLHLLINGERLCIERIVDDKCYLINSKDGGIKLLSKSEIAEGITEEQIFIDSSEEGAKKCEHVAADMSVLSEKEQQCVERKLDYISDARQALGEKPTNKQLKAVILFTAEKRNEKPPAISTVYEWWRRWHSNYHDISSLVNKRTGSSKPKRLSNFVLTLFDNLVEEVYLNEQRVMKSKVYEIFEHKLHYIKSTTNPDIHIPSRAQFYRLFKRFDPYQVMLAREGKYAAERHFRLTGSGVRVTRILERVEVDHTPLNILVVSDTTGLAIGRPNLTTLIDYNSKMILGFEVGFEPPSELSVMRALKNAILTKGYLAKKYSSIKETWPSHGIPTTLICDNGLEFHSKNLRRVCHELTVE